MTEPPKRLAETESGALGESLSTAKQAVPSSEQLARLAERLAGAGVVVAPGPSAPPAPLPPAPGKGLALRMKVGIGVAGAGTAALVALLGRSPGEEPKASDRGRDSVASVVPPASSPPARGDAQLPPAAPVPVPVPKPTQADDSAPALDGVSGEVSPERAPEAQAPLPRAAVPAVPKPQRDPGAQSAWDEARPASPPSSSSPPSPDAPQVASKRAEPPEPAPQAPESSEVELLKEARNRVASDPEGALLLVRRHRSEFPFGAFAQERDFIAISALVRLGRTGEARALASAFRKRYPRSAYLPRVERLLGESP